MPKNKKATLTGSQLIVLANSLHVAYISQFLNKSEWRNKHIIIKDSDEFSELQNIYDFDKVTDIFCLVCVETGWTKNVFDGYDRALSLMTTELANEHVLHIYFYSFRSRKQLFEVTESHNKYRGLTKSFKHFQLPFQHKKKLELQKTSAEKWEFLRNFTVTQSGFLASLKHDLEGLKSRSTKDEKSYENIKDRITKNPSFFGSEIVALVNANKMSKISGKLLEKINDLIQSLNGTENPGEEFDISKRVEYRMMILEDNDDDRVLLKNAFERFYEINEDGLFSSGEAALDYLEKKNSFVDVLICDLELLTEEGFDQDVQGIDVIAKLKSRYPHISLRITTNIPRKGLYYLSGNKILAKEVIFKSALFTGDPQYLADVIKSLGADIQSKQKLINLRGPEYKLWTSGGNSPGHLKKYFYHLKYNESNVFEELWNNVISDLQKVKEESTKINTDFGGIHNIKTIAFPNEHKKQRTLEILHNILVNRLFWISEYYSPENRNIAFNPESMKVKYFDGSRKLEKLYFSIIGFGCSKIGIYGSEEITFGEFLDDEREWYIGQNLREDIKSNIQTEIDYLNSDLLAKTIEILEEIDKAGGQYFTKSNYPSFITQFKREIEKDPTNPKKFVEIFKSIGLEKSSEELRSGRGDSREMVFYKLDEIISLSEYKSYPDDLQMVIKSAKNQIK